MSKKYLDNTGLSYFWNKINTKKQNTLVSGTNIKTINNQSLLGSGNISISGGGGSAIDVQINGTSIVSNDVANIVTNSAYSGSTNKIATMSDISGKQDTLVSGTNIKTINNESLLSSGNITVLTSHQDITGKQNVTDNTLETTSKTIPSAINEVNSVAKGANQALSYSNYQSMVTAFNGFNSTKYNVGQNVMIVTLEVPDLWISGIESTSSSYTYTSDSAIVTALQTNGYIKVGYYKLSMLETQKVDLTNYVQSSQLLNAIYPVGSIYMSVNNTSPATLFGGTWQQIKDTFLLASGSTYSNGSTGGSSTHTLTINEMPSHTHVQDAHNHTFNARKTDWGRSGSNNVLIDATAGYSSITHSTDIISSTTATNQNTGGGQAHNNMPPYLAVYMWKRTS